MKQFREFYYSVLLEVKQIETYWDEIGNHFLASLLTSAPRTGYFQ